MEPHSGQPGLDLAMAFAYACDRGACQISAPTVGGRSHEQDVAGRPCPTARATQPRTMEAAGARAAPGGAPVKPRRVDAAAGPAGPGRHTRGAGQDTGARSGADQVRTEDRLAVRIP